jgi:membrane-bound lytic murein transglycosylase D
LRAKPLRALAPRSLPSLALLVACTQLVACTRFHRPAQLLDTLSDATGFLTSRSAEPQLSHAPTSAVLVGPPASAISERMAREFSVSHPRIDAFVASYRTQLRGFYQRALDRGGRYLPQIEGVLRREQLPSELAYLPLIESGFRLQAVSHAGAVGPWQIIRSTARRYGLRIDGYVDERRDPLKSTQAAARYLKDLYAQFGDWHLSLAAYNSGEMKVARALELGETGDYWEISARGLLKPETRDFVPRFLAAVQIARAPEAYGFDGPETEPFPYETVRVDRSVALTTVAKLAKVSATELTELNPALHRGVTPPTGYPLRVPAGTKSIVELALARIRHDATQVVAASVPATATARTHRMKRGETLGAIAKRYRVSVPSLMKLNGIRDPRRVAAGRVLRLPSPAAPVRAATARRPSARVAVRRSR